jgi:hypothetical protein
VIWLQILDPIFDRIQLADLADGHIRLTFCPFIFAGAALLASTNLRRATRQARSGPRLDVLHDWLQEILHGVSRKSAPAKAIGYTRSYGRR